MSKSMRVLIIGGGPAAIEAALTARLFVEDVTIISNHRIGDWRKLGISSGLLEYYDDSLIWEDALHDIKGKLDKWSNNMNKIIFNRGIRVFLGEISSIYPYYVQFFDRNNNKKEFYFNKLFIAIGSSKYITIKNKTDCIDIIRPDNIEKLNKLPRTMIVIGNGPISYESVNIFHNKGVDVKWLAPQEGPSTPFDPCISDYLNNLYRRRGIEIRNGEFVRNINKKDNGVAVIRGDGTEYIAEKVFISIGLQTNINQVDVNRLGFEYSNEGEILTGELGRTNRDHIYIIGDARKANNASLSMKQGRLAVLDALSNQRVDYRSLSSNATIFNQNPQVAVIGILSKESKNALQINFKDRNIKSLLGSTIDGFIKITWDKDYRITSASVIGDHAAEIITPISLAMELKASLKDLMNYYPPHPSKSEVAFTLLREIEHQIIKTRE